MSCPEPQTPFGPAVPPRPLVTLPDGRPRSLTDEMKKAIAMLIVQGHSLGAAAAYVACDRKTIYNERQRDKNFDSNIKRAFGMRNIGPLNVIRISAKSSWRAAAWMIEYSDKVQKEKRGRSEKRLDRLELLAHRPSGGDDDLAETPAKTFAESLDQPEPIAKVVVDATAESIAETATQSPSTEPVACEAAAAWSRSPQPNNRVANRSPSVLESRIDAAIAAIDAELQAQARQRLSAAGCLPKSPDEFPHVGKNAADLDQFFG